VKIGWLKKDPNEKFAIKTMKKNDIIQSKHVDHIENEKNILECLDHPFSVSPAPNSPHNSFRMTGSSKIIGSFTSRRSCSVAETCSPTTEV
jgi:hypothetical protein